MKIEPVHSWDLSPQEAIRLQESLRHKIASVFPSSVDPIRRVAGADLAFSADRQQALAGVIVYSYPDLREIERRHAKVPVRYPYIPGLLAFREGPALLEAFSQVESEPDVVFFDGQGIAHPRGCGIACHMGLFLNKPSIGCGKSRLFGRYEAPGPRAGDRSPLMDRERPIGAVLRTKENGSPLFISIGHRIDLETAVALTLACCDGYRIPKPTREADAFVGKLKLGQAIPRPAPTQPSLPF